MGVLLSVLACSREPLQPLAELSDFAGYQRDQVTTRAISPADPISAPLAAYGWRIMRREEEPPQFVLRRDRAQVWFFSAQGNTKGVEFHLAPESQVKGLRHRLNRDEFELLVFPDESVSPTLEFAPDQVRRGWNVLELRLRSNPGSTTRPGLRLRGFRFLTGDDERPTAAQRIEKSSGGLSLPGESYLDLVMELPPDARFEALAASEAASEAAELAIRLVVTDDAGTDTVVVERTLEAGGTTEIDQALDEWSGQRVRLRLEVSGSPQSAVVFEAARVVAPNAKKINPNQRLIRPTAPDSRTDLGRPHVVVIVLDAARADAFSPFGSEYPTPAIQKLADQGTSFTQTLSPSSWTGQSMPAIFTGFYPDTLGVRQWGDSLAARVPTLAELFSNAGYHTTLWSQHPLYSRGKTFARGFRRQVHSPPDRPELLPEIEDLFEGDKPTFALVHLLPPHAPYTPPAPFAHQLTSDYTGDIDWNIQMLSKFPKRRDPASLSPEDRRYIRGRYQENAAFADHLVGTLVAGLEASGRYDDTLIAVVSDHGEAFLEHDLFLHASRTYREFVHVPFVIKWPSRASSFKLRVEDPVSLVDLAPTLASGLKLPGADGGFQGLDLLPAVFENSALNRSLYAITRGDGSPFRGPKRWLRIERDGWSLVWGQMSDTAELYDLAADPTEQSDLAQTHPTLALELLQQLQMQYFFNQTLFDVGLGEVDELDPQLVEELRALGYL